MSVAQGEHSLTHGEWNVMECLWEQAPRTAMQLVPLLQERAGWAKSTTLTMLSRMEAKGLVRSQVQGRARAYWPNVRREDAARQETRSFLRRVYQGSVGLMLSAMTQDEGLTREELDELYEILRQAEERERGG